MLFRQIVDDKLSQYAYLIGCQRTGQAIVIDPERDVDRYFAAAAKEGLELVAAADTHIHADYLSGTRELAERGLKIYASDEGGPDWRYEWLVGSDYDHELLHDGDTFEIGNIEFRAVHTPGHTPEHMGFLVTDHGGGADEPMGLLSGDFVFVGDVGRPDLLESAAGQAGNQEPSARTLYGSIQRFLELPDFLQVWPAHGAGSACGKALGAVPESTVGYERRFNASIDAARRGEDAFVESILDAQPEPPLYFGRMKRENREGPAVLGELPTPRRVATDELDALAGRDDVALVDTRPDRSAFMARHVRGSLYAPFDSSFNTVVGSYVEPGTPIYVVIDEANVGDAVRDLVRIGLDDIAGWIAPADLAAYLQDGEHVGAIEEITFDDLEAKREAGLRVLDVRRLSEHRSGHVPGAQNVAHTRLLDRLDEVARDQTHVVHCAGGVRAAVASALLASRGYDVVYVNDRFSHWREIGPVEEGEAQPA